MSQLADDIAVARESLAVAGPSRAASLDGDCSQRASIRVELLARILSACEEMERRLQERITNCGCCEVCNNADRETLKKVRGE